MRRDGTGYLPTLDGWRAVAITVVLFGHVSVGLGLGRFKEVGLVGVQIFFGLSGFLITTILLDQECKAGAISLRGFYTRRAFRILPAAIVFLSTVGLLGLLGAINLTFARWASSLLFMANYSHAQVSWYLGHFWSLAVEEHFYLIWPAFLLLVRGNRKRLCIALPAALLVALWRAVDFKYRLTWTDSAWFWGRSDINADSILFGVIYALALADGRLGPAFRRIFAMRFAAPLSIGALLFTLLAHGGWKLNFLLMTLRAAVIPAMIVATLNRPHGSIGQILELSPLRFIGLISYSLYLWQQIFVTWDPSPRLAEVQWFPLNITAAITCATLSYFLIETPFINMGRRLLRMQRSHVRLQLPAIT